MSPMVLLAELRERGIGVLAVGDRLRVEAPRGALTSDLREALARHKAGLLALLREPPTTARPGTLRSGTKDQARRVVHGKLAVSGELAELGPRQPVPESCHVCRGRRWWRSVHGPTVCVLCHPPASRDLVAGGITSQEPGPA